MKNVNNDDDDDHDPSRVHKMHFFQWNCFILNDIGNIKEATTFIPLDYLI